MKIKPAVPLVDLKEPIKSTDFVLLEKIKNQRAAGGLKKTDASRQMPRLDEHGTSNKPIEGNQVQKENLVPLQWAWLKEVHKHAVLIDEINKIARRKVQWEELERATEQHAQLISDLKLDEHVSANLAAAKELGRFLKKHDMRADRDWRLWIDKIDRRREINNRELLELFMKSMGYKVGFIRQAWNQRHLTEMKVSLSRIALDERHEVQQLHLEEQEKLDAFKQESKRLSEALNLANFKDKLTTKLLNFEQFKSEQQEQKADQATLLLMRAMGFGPGFMPLPAKHRELLEQTEKLARMKVEIKMQNYKDIEKFHKKLAALQSFALSAEGRQLLLKQIDQKTEQKILRESDRLEHEALEHQLELYRAFMAAMGYAIGFIPLPWKRLEIEEKKQQLDEIAKKQNDPGVEQPRAAAQKQLALAEPSSGEKTTEQTHEKSPLAELPPLKPKAFKDAYSPVGSKKVEFSEKEEEVARLKIEYDRKEEMGLLDFQKKLAQLQSASAHMAQANATTSAGQSHEMQEKPVDVRQKIKAAK